MFAYLLGWMDVTHESTQSFWVEHRVYTVIESTLGMSDNPPNAKKSRKYSLPPMLFIWAYKADYIVLL